MRRLLILRYILDDLVERLLRPLAQWKMRRRLRARTKAVAEAWRPTREGDNAV